MRMPAHALSYRALLRLPDMAALLLATTLSRLAGRMVALAVVLFALSRTGSPTLAGWMAFALFAPGLIASPIAGALIDRSGAVWAIAADMAASAACLLGLALADCFGWTSAPVLLTLAAVFSLTSPLSAAGIRTLVPRLVQHEARDRANALDTSIHGVTDIIGPALAGLLVGFAGAVPTFVLIAVLYAATAICVGRIRAPHPRPARSRALLPTALTGLIRVARTPTLRAMALSYSLYQLTWGALLVVVPVVAARHVAGEAASAATGLLWAGSGVVGVIGALVAGRLRTLGRERPTMALGMAVTALAAGPIAATHGLFGLAACLMLIAAAAGPVDIAVLTLRQRRTDPAELGRVLSVSMSLNLAGIPIGSALAGMLLPWSLPATFAVAALASLLAAAATALIPPDDAATDA
jgi:MFS family permease